MKKLLLLLLINSCIALSIRTSAQTDSIGKQNDLKTVRPTLLDMSGTTVYLNNQPISLSKAKSILSAYPIILEQFVKAKSLRSSGKGMLIGGGIIMVSGIVVMINGANESINNYGENTSPNGKYFVGLGMTVLGELLLDAGIASTIVGKIKMHRAISNYNRALLRDYRSSTLGYKVGFLDNGRVGVLLTF